MSRMLAQAAAVGAVAMIIVGSATVSSQLTPAPPGAVTKYPLAKYRTKPFQERHVIEELHYHFRVADYDPPVAIWPTKDAAPPHFKSPESTLQDCLSRMAEPQYTAYLECWTTTDRAALESENRKERRTAQFWEEKWRQLFANYATAELISRVETGGYVILAYRLTPKAGSKTTAFDHSAAFKRTDDGSWKQTNDLAADPVFQMWQASDRVLRRTVRRD